MAVTTNKPDDGNYVRVCFENGWDGYYYAAKIITTSKATVNSSTEATVTINIKADFYKKPTSYAKGPNNWSAYNGWFRFHAVKFRAYFNNNLCDGDDLNCVIKRYNSSTKSYANAEISPDANNYWPFIGRGVLGHQTGGETIGANSSMVPSTSSGLTTDHDKADITITKTIDISNSKTARFRLEFIPWWLGVNATGYDYDSCTINITPKTSIIKGRVTIKDNYNNSFKITANKGTAGLNNNIPMSTVHWATSKTGTTWNYSIEEFYTSPYEKIVTFSASNDSTTRKNATRPVAAFSRSHADDATTEDSTVKTENIKQYCAPGTVSSAPVIGYTKSRLTIKENWTVSWGSADKVNDSSPVVGYRIRLYRKAAGATSFSLIPIKTETESKSTTNGTDIYYDRNSTTTQMTFYAAASGINPGDQVKFSIQPYTKYGQNNNGDILLNGTRTESSVYTVKNAGTVRVRANSTWKESEAEYVRANGEWKEIEAIYVRANGAWKEAE